jgi:hypothetical protein
MRKRASVRSPHHDGGLACQRQLRRFNHRAPAARVAWRPPLTPAACDSSRAVPTNAEPATTSGGSTARRSGPELPVPAQQVVHLHRRQPTQLGLRRRVVLVHAPLKERVDLLQRAEVAGGHLGVDGLNPGRERVFVLHGCFTMMSADQLQRRRGTYAGSTGSATDAPESVVDQFQGRWLTRFAAP